MPRKKHFSEKLETRVKAAEKAAEKAAAKQPIERGKDKAADFVRLAEKRLFKALEAIRLCGNLSNSNDYTSTKEQVLMMFDAIREETAAAEARFKIDAHKQRRGRIKLAA
jgi:hypothetical protein